MAGQSADCSMLMSGDRRVVARNSNSAGCYDIKC